MNRFGRINLTFVFFLAGLFIFTSFSQGQNRPPSPVVIATVVKKEVRSPMVFIGNARPRKRSLVASEVAGLVVKFPVEEGVYVKEKEVLAQLDKKALRLELKNIEASKEEAKSQLELVKRKVKRLTKLYSKRVASFEELEDRRFEKKVWQSRVQSLKARLSRLEYDLDRSQIQAPFNGFIVKINTEVGQWLSKGDPVAELVDLDTIDVMVNVPERYIAKIHSQDQVSLTFDALKGESFQGKVFAIIPEASRSSGNFPVKVRLKNDGNKIKAGMLARVTFLVGQKEKRVMVPKDAIVEEGRFHFIYVVADNKVQKRRIKPTSYFKKWVEVKGKIKEGEQVVIRGNERLRPGQPVRIVGEKKFDLGE